MLHRVDVKKFGIVTICSGRIDCKESEDAGRRGWRRGQGRVGGATGNSFGGRFLAGFLGAILHVDDGFTG